MRHITHTMLALLVSTFMFGCGTAPTVREQQPWTRILRSSLIVDPQAKMKSDVSGSTVPLLGSEQLTAEKIRESVSSLLTRRGFSIEDSAPDYNVKLSYLSERTNKAPLSSAVASANGPADAAITGSHAGAHSGLGVIVSRAVSALAARSAGSGGASAEQASLYTHTLALEIRNQEGLIAWKGESTWDSNQLNILDRCIPAIQLMVSDLPADSSVRPAIQEIKTSHIPIFYKLECLGASFTCPALPYGSMFDYPGVSPSAKIDIPKTFRDQYAFGAYIDLLQTAEYALPSGTVDDWKDPIRISLWKKVTLGGQYLMGPEKKPVNVIMKLSARSIGYFVDECYAASDEDYAIFSAQLSKWKQALADYYDVYAQ